jgi:hypothetical protein
LTGTIGTLPAGYVDAVATIATVTVNIVVADADKEITGFTPLAAVNLNDDDPNPHLVNLALLIASGKLPTTVTVTDGITTAPADITNWTGTFDGTTPATYTLTAVWTLPAGYVDLVDPITVEIIVYVNFAQTP